MARPVAFLPFVLLGLLPAPAAAQQDASLRVRVTDADTRQPLVSAQVHLPELYLYWITNPQGVATATGVPPGQYRFEVTMLGYAPLQGVLELEGGSVEADVQLVVQPIEIDGVTASVASIDRVRYSAPLARSGFYDRIRRGGGHAMDRLLIEQRNPVQPSDLFRGIPGVRVLFDPQTREYVLVTASGFSGFGGGLAGCLLDVYVDGIRSAGPIDSLAVEWIEGVEVYTRANIPIQYSRTGDQTCGVVLIWTA